MRELLEKLDVRSTDFVATVGHDDGFFLADLKNSTRGLACVGEINKKLFSGLRSVRSLESEKQLDDSAFDKIIAIYDDYLSLDDLIRAADHKGMILVSDIPRNILDDPKVAGGRKGLLMKFHNKGIFEVWFLRGRQKGTFDLLFKVRKFE
jgi:hypothetical protein